MEMSFLQIRRTKLPRLTCLLETSKILSDFLKIFVKCINNFSRRKEWLEPERWKSQSDHSTKVSSHHEHIYQTGDLKICFLKFHSQQGIRQILGQIEMKSEESNRIIKIGPLIIDERLSLKKKKKPKTTLRWVWAPVYTLR